MIETKTFILLWIFTGIIGYIINLFIRYSFRTGYFGEKGVLKNIDNATILSAIFEGASYGFMIIPFIVGTIITRITTDKHGRLKKFWYKNHPNTITKES